MKVRASKETEFLSSNSKDVFNLDFDECKKLDSTEKDLLIDTYIQPAFEDKTAKQELIKLATSASNKGELVFRQIANKKNAPIEKISSVFRQAIDKSETALYNVANSMIKVLNSTPTAKENTEALSMEHFSSEGKDYIVAISLLCQELLRKNIIWFLKIVGYPPTAKQIDMINDYFAKCEEEERIAASTKSMLEESISPLNSMIGGNKDSITELKAEVEKLENAIQVLNMRRQQLNAELSLKISEIENKLNNYLNQQKGNDKINEVIADLDKKSADQYSELSKKIIDIDFVKAIISDNIEPINTKISGLSHNTDNLANSLTKMILQNKNSLIDEHKIVTELKDSISLVKQQIQEVKNRNTDTVGNDSNLYIEKGRKLSGNLEKCDEVDVFVDILNDNFKRYTNISAEYVTSILQSDTVPLFCGFNAREVAAIVSASLCGELPSIISIPNDYNNIEGIIDICRSTDTGVILIEDLLGSMNERLIFSLLRAYRRNIVEFRDKGMCLPYIFMSCESTEDFKLLPLSLFNHVTVIQCPDYIKSIDYNKLDLGDAEKVLSSNDYKKSNENRQFKMKVLKSSLPNVYYQIKNDIVSRFNNGVMTLIDNEIRYILPDEEVKVFQNE